MGSRHHDIDDRRTTAVDCLTAGIDAAHPREVIANAVTFDGRTLVVDEHRIDLDRIDDVLIAGGGNAAGHVVAALESILGDRIDGGAVVTDDPVHTDRVTVREGTHPLPSAENVSGARAVLEIVDAASRDDLVLAVVTGGGSALLCAPTDGVTLADVREVTDGLLKSGATIEECNAVRKHLSAVKGGQLAERAAPARVLGLVISDVVGDRLDVIASGPTAPDGTTYEDALGVLDRYDVTPPSSVADCLERGRDGARAETPDADDPCFRTVDNHVLANADTALEAAAHVASTRGYEPSILSTRLRGEARDVATTHVAIAEEIAATGRPVEPPAAILSGGETTVTVRGDGSGGPNLEFALSAALELVGEPEIVVGSVDTDGFDGGTAVAGAVVDGDTVTDREAATAALRSNDAGGFFDGRDELVRTGATGTNVNDLRVVLVAGERSDGREATAQF